MVKKSVFLEISQSEQQIFGSSLNGMPVSGRMKNKSIKKLKGKELAGVGHTYHPPHLVVKHIGDNTYT